MTTITSHHHEDQRDHEERVRAIGAVLAAGVALTGLLIGMAFVVSQVVALLEWSFVSH